ncbi:recombinase RecT [Vibrio penaeicida]|uniref:recombinase RecT n=1 Tax=Vibrio penaeicida TaxID=104609 RepID=UPI001CC4E78F|nr:recombinase RecT [Vibrio penaeicida]
MSVQLSDQELAILNAEPESVNSNVDITSMMFNPDLMPRLERFAELMASGKSTVPTHLRGNPGDCLAVTIQAMQWRMNPIQWLRKPTSSTAHLVMKRNWSTP